MQAEPEITNIIRFPCFTRISGPGADLVEKALTFSKKIPLVRDGQVFVGKSKMSLVERVDAKTIELGSGLFYRVLELLRARELPRRIVAHAAEPRPYVAPPIPPPTNSEIPVELRNLLRFQYECTSESKRLSLLLKLLRAFPDGRVAIVVKTRDQRRRLREFIWRELNENVYVGCGDQQSERISICCTHAIEREAHVLIVYDALLALNQEFRDAYGGFHHVVHVAFRSTDKRMSERAELELEGYFGPVFDAANNRPFRVVAIPYTYSSARSSRQGGTKQSLIWSNDERNQFIARLSQFLLGKVGCGETSFHGVRRNIHDWLADEEYLRLAILAENDTHARCLADLLPEWRRHFRDAYEPGARRRLRLGDLEHESWSHITTLAAALAQDTLDANVLILADGGAISAESTQCVASKMCYKRVAIVDVSSSHVRQGQLSTDRRHKVFRQLGWLS